MKNAFTIFKRHKNPVIISAVLVIVIAILIFALVNHDKNVNSTSDQSKFLTFDTISGLLNEKGKEHLTWSDFNGYEHEDIGSGLYVYKYEVEDDYILLIGGAKLETDPQYIYLENADGEKIDIRYDDINDFIKDHSDNN